MVQTFIDEKQLTAVSYQLYRDSEAILEHWRLADPYIAEVMQHCTVAAFEICGEPNAAVMERMNTMIQDVALPKWSASRVSFGNRQTSNHGWRPFSKSFARLEGIGTKAPAICFAPSGRQSRYRTGSDVSFL
jgi:hypothetical protein